MVGGAVQLRAPETSSQRDSADGPAAEMRPAEATEVRGSFGSVRLAPVSWRQLIPLKTSGIGTGFPFSSAPAIVTTSPSGSVVTVGYHRAYAMFGPGVHEAVAGSKMSELGWPRPLPVPPPDTSRRPSGSQLWPL